MIFLFFCLGGSYLKNTNRKTKNKLSPQRIIKYIISTIFKNFLYSFRHVMATQIHIIIFINENFMKLDEISCFWINSETAPEIDLPYQIAVRHFTRKNLIFKILRLWFWLSIVLQWGPQFASGNFYAQKSLQFFACGRHLLGYGFVYRCSSTIKTLVFISISKLLLKMTFIMKLLLCIFTP
jgi:hypothetical protein